MDLMEAFFFFFSGWFVIAFLALRNLPIRTVSSGLKALILSEKLSEVLITKEFEMS